MGSKNLLLTLKKSPYTRAMFKSFRALWSWAFYDFANTIFSAVVLTAFFPLYFTRIAGSNLALGSATTSAMIFSAGIIPFLGALSDQTGKTKTYLVRITLLCIAAMAALSFFKHPAALYVCFWLACIFYHASLVFYNSLLPVVAPPQIQGFASGLGVSLGYLGVVICLPFAGWISHRFGEASVFAATAVIFLIASFPLFFFVPERKVEKPVSFRFSLLKSEWRKMLDLVREIWKKPVLLGFFAGNFFAVDAVNAMILWFSVYAREMFHPSQKELISLLMAVNASAFVMGIITGFLTDRLGALKTQILSTAALMATLLALTLVPDFQSFIAVSVLGGAFSIAGTWTAGRKVVAEFAPQDKVGEYFGLYGLTTKISILGNLIFSIVADTAGFKPALRVLLFPGTVGFLFLIFSAFSQERDRKRQRS